MQVQVQDPTFEVLFLGENSAWSKLSASLAEESCGCLNLQRRNTLSGLLQTIAAGRCHAVALDVHAWNFQGLRFVEKIRSKYPTLPILALYSPALPNLDSKALTSGASRCISLDKLDARELYSAVATSLAESYFKPQVRKESPLQLSSTDTTSSTGSGYPLSKNQLISHALNNLLCVISANADVLADHLSSSGPGAHSLIEIKKAAQSAAALMRTLK